MITQYKSSFNAAQTETRSMCLGQVLTVGLLRGVTTLSWYGVGDMIIYIDPLVSFLQYCLIIQKLLFAVTKGYNSLRNKQIININTGWCTEIAFPCRGGGGKKNLMFFFPKTSLGYFCQKHNDMVFFFFTTIVFLSVA